MTKENLKLLLKLLTNYHHVIYYIMGIGYKNVYFSDAFCVFALKYIPKVCEVYL